MEQRKLILSIVAVTVLALLSIMSWLTELLLTFGWNSSDWLWAPQYAIFGINLMVVSAYLLPVRLLQKTPWRALVMLGLELYFVAVIAFFVTKSILYSLFLPISFFNLSVFTLCLMLGVLAITTASSCYYLTRNYLYPVKITFIPLLVGVEMLAAVFSLLTAYLYFQIEHLDGVLMAAVQAGLPFFYFTLLIGLFSIFSIRKLGSREVREDQEEILDDMEFPE